MKRNGVKPVYMYDLEGNLIKEFESTRLCADYFEKEAEYINHSLKYYKKIRKDDKWYIIKRIKDE